MGQRWLAEGLAKMDEHGFLVVTDLDLLRGYVEALRGRDRVASDRHLWHT